MQALTVTQPPAALRPTPHPEPTPGPDDITIDVQVAGVGLIDALWVSGAMPSLPGFVPGLEVAGTVRGIGASVTGFAPGQTVAAFLPAAGGFAPIARTPATLAAAVPPGLAVDLAAVVPANTVTAHLALTTVARLAPDDDILVHAGVGGLGSQFLQVARTIGAGRIEAVVGTPDKQRIARDIGYDDAHLRSQLPDLTDARYDLVVDPVGGDATADAFRVLRSGGRLLRVGNASQAPGVMLDSLAHWLQNKSTVGFNVGAWLGDHPEQGTTSLRWALQAVADGRVRVDLTEVSDLTAPDGLRQVTRLIERLERGDTTGKVAIRLG